MIGKKPINLVVLSGKGGTGKTTVASALAELVENKILVDADVDAANMYLVLKHQVKSEINFFGGKKAEIDLSICLQCALCESICRFEAIKNSIVDKTACEGCGFCFRICPVNAISFEKVESGIYYNCELEDKSSFYYAKTHAGEGNTGKLVSELKKNAVNNTSDNTEWIIIDGPPGIGCPVNASLTGADYALIVTEPTQSGLHDLKRLVELLKRFKVPSGFIINKYDINSGMSDNIEKFIKKEGFVLLDKIPFDRMFIKAIQNYKTINKFDRNYERKFKNIIEKIHNFMNNKMENKMKIAVTSTGGSLDALISERFGRCQYFIIYDSSTQKFEAVSNLGEQLQSGAGPKAAELISNRGAEVLLTGQVGDKAETALNKAGIKIVTGFEPALKVKDAIQKYLNENK